MKKQLWTLLNSIGVFLAFLGLWEGFILVFQTPSYLLPGPWSVALAIVEHFSMLTDSLLITAMAAAGGLVASIVSGVMIALVFAQWRWLRRMLYPYTILLQTVPIVAIAPLIIMWAGPGVFSVGVVAYIVSLAPIIANTTQGLISVEENLINLFLMHNAKPSQILLQLRLPHAVPNLFVGIRISAGIAVIGAIVGETFAGSSSLGHGGLGYSILYASAQLQTGYLFALVFAATVLGFVFFFTAAFLEWCFLHQWHESARGAEQE